MEEQKSSMPAPVALAAVGLVVLLALPAIPYIATFGATLSHEHSTWGEFGDFYGALLSVLLGALTVILLLLQLYVTQRAANAQAIDAARQLRHARAATDAAHDAVFALESFAIEPSIISPMDVEAACLTLSNYGSIVLNVSTERLTSGYRVEFAHTDYLAVLKSEIKFGIYIAPPPKHGVQFHIYVQRRDGTPRRHLMLFQPEESKLTTMMVEDTK